MTSKDDYFLSDGLYVREDQLEESKSLLLNVVKVNPVQTSHVLPTGKHTDPYVGYEPHEMDHVEHLFEQMCSIR